MTNNDITDKSLDYCCAECRSEIVRIWDEENNKYRWCCAADHTHNGFQRKLSDQKAVMRGEADKLIGPGAQKEFEERAKESKTAMALIPKDDLGTGKYLTIMQIGELVTWAERHGLNAKLGHVCLFYGQPYRTIDGLYYQNNKRTEPFRVGVKPMTEEEKKAYMVEEATHAFIATAWLGGEELSVTGIGFVTKDEIEAKSTRTPTQYRSPVVHSHPQRMAEKRAEWQVLRKLIPLEEVGG